MTSPNSALKRMTLANTQGEHYRAPYFSMARQAFKEGDVERKEMLEERRADQRARKGTRPKDYDMVRRTDGRTTIKNPVTGLDTVLQSHKMVPRNYTGENLRDLRERNGHSKIKA